MNDFTVYVHVSPEGKRYVGKTCRTVLARSGIYGQN